MRVRTPEVLELAKPDAAPAHLVLIDVARQLQALTFDKVTLAGRQEFEDASDRNNTLIVALSDIRLEAVKNLGDESQWRPGSPKLIALSEGQTFWLASGIYHLRNTRAKPAKFLTVEW